jgi:putative ABC transport system substrate-binding protein
MASYIGRRKFLATLGGAAVVGPYAAVAQQASKTAKVGILYPGTAASLPSRVAGLRDGLQTAGYREPDSVELLPRAAEGDPTRIPPLAAELAGRKVDVIVAVSPPAVQAALAASTTIPIVALDLESDPITSGLIKSFSQPWSCCLRRSSAVILSVSRDLPLDFGCQRSRCFQSLLEPAG